MTPSPAFLYEMAAQVAAAREDLTTAVSRGEEIDERVATARLAELEELLSRATDDSLRTIPSLR